jgi:hypothetical protein
LVKADAPTWDALDDARVLVALLDDVGGVEVAPADVERGDHGDLAGGSVRRLRAFARSPRISSIASKRPGRKTAESGGLRCGLGGSERFSAASHTI